MCIHEPEWCWGELEKVHVSKMGQGLAGWLHLLLTLRRRVQGGWIICFSLRKGKETAILILQPPDFFLILGRVIFIHTATMLVNHLPSVDWQGATCCTLAILTTWTFLRKQHIILPLSFGSCCFLCLKCAQSCPTLSDPMDCSLPGSAVRGIFQARVLEWGVR